MGWVVLFFALVTGLRAGKEDELRKALDQLSVSYADAQRKLGDREAAVRTLTESLAIARTESELFQKLWTEAQVRLQSVGQNLADADAVAQQRQFVETLRQLYLAESERQRLAAQLQRLVAAVESNANVAVEIESTKRLLAAGEKPAPVRSSGSIEAAKVLEVNPLLESDPAKVNADPYGDGWMVKVEMSDATQVSGLLDAANYDELTGK